MSEPAWFGRLAAAFAENPESPFQRVGMPGPPPGGQPRHSAVLMLFAGSNPGETGEAGDGGGELLLTQRSSTLRAHPGQVAFPGGRIDDTDSGPEAAALREAQEEAGVEPGGVQIAGCGPRLYLPVTDYYVTPVLAWWRERGELGVGDPAEVDRVVMVRLSELTDPACRFTLAHPSGYLGPAFAAGGLLIWGFTAGVINWMLGLAGLEREWDASVLRPLPSQPIRGERELQQFLQGRAERADKGKGGASPGLAAPRERLGRHEELGMAE